MLSRMMGLTAVLCAMMAAAGCYRNATHARTVQTQSAYGWACVAEPVVECPEGECTGWSRRWSATCPDDGSRWACQFVGGRGDVQCRPLLQPTATTRATPRSQPAHRRDAPPTRREEDARAERMRPRLTYHTDEFTGRSRLEFRVGVPIDVPDAIGGVALVSIVRSEEGNAFFMVGAGFREGWRWLECHHVDLLVNGEPFRVAAQEEHDGEVERGYVAESVVVPLTPVEATALMSATSLRFRVCTDVMEVGAGALAVMRGEVASSSPAPR